ncbi:MAG: PD-(D/E)XK nuclease family protein, partial [Bacteroidia bacterium]
FARIVRRLRTLTERWPFVQELRALRLLLMQTVQTTNLPFYGEPLAGLQIMGLLETRTLDFDRVILLATNENILPSARAQPSFIVYDLRVAFGLPVWHERDAVYAHHFYHLLQRAKDVTLVYNTEPDTFGSGERSRFVTQVMYELPKINPQVEVNTVLFDTGTPSNTEAAPIIIPKSEQIQTRLRELATHGLSPSLLNSFRSCSLQFYFRYIAGLREAEDVEETIGADTLGTVMHAALENLFERVKGEVLTPALLQKLKDSIHAACRKAFEEFCPPEELGFGKNLLAERIAEKYLHTFFDKEIARAKKLEKSGLSWKVEALETELRSEIKIKGESVFLRGTADRIDRIGDTIQLIDYKTGKADDVELSVKNWDDVTTNTKIGKSVQLLTYALMYADTTQYTGALLSGIITFRELSKAQLLKPVKTPSGEILTTDVLDEFRNSLTQLLHTIFDPEKSFTQTDEPDTCRICAFKGICGRE